jgi:hypothetical protein
MFTILAEEANFVYAGPTGCRRRQLPRVWLLGLDGIDTASNAAFPLLTRVWLSVYRTGDGRAVRRSATSVASPVSPATLFRRRPGVVQGIIRRGGGGCVLGWSCPHSVGGRERGPLRAR